MPKESAMAAISGLAATTGGVFRGRDAVARGVKRERLRSLVRQGVVERVLPDTFRMTAVNVSPRQRLYAALLWAGDVAAAAGRSAGEVYRLEGVRASEPEIVLPYDVRGRMQGITTYHGEPRALMIRTVDGVRVTGVEATLMRLASIVDAEAFEIACEDARRRRLTTLPALEAYLARFGKRGRPGTTALRALLTQLDPAHPARSTLEVMTRRLLVAHGITDFARELPLEGNGRTYFYDFAFPSQRVVLETNGRRWHDDASDYERDHEKWSVPGRHGYRVVFATWQKVTRAPVHLLRELTAAIAA
jgi:very-short-patch-repair endonuclease